MGGLTETNNVKCNKPSIFACLGTIETDERGGNFERVDARYPFHYENDFSQLSS